MVASLLSSNVTVAFILGALFCAVPVFLDWIGTPTGAGLRRQIEDWSVPAQFQDFGTGVITLSGLFYFSRLAVAMLYLNMVLLGRRHWAGGEASQRPLAPFGWSGSLAVVLALFSVTVMLERLGMRADASAEQAAHAFARIARAGQADSRRPAGADPGLLQSRCAPRVRRDQGRPAGPAQGIRGPQRRQDPPEPGADRALFGRRPARPRSGSASSRGGSSSDDQGKQMSSEVFLGVAFTSGVEEVVIPFFDRGLPVEYELTRSIRVVSRERPQEGRHPEHRRQDDGRVRHAELQPDAGMVDRHRAQEAIRRQLGLARLADLLRPRCPAGRPAVVADPEADRQPDRLREEGRGDAALPRSVARRQSADLARAAQDAAGRTVRRRPAARAQGQPAAPARPDRARLADRPRSSGTPTTRIRSLPTCSTPEIVFIGKGSGADGRVQPRADRQRRACRRSSPSSPGCSGPKRGLGAGIHPAASDQQRGRHVSWSDAVQQGFMGISGINPRRRHIPTGHELHAGRPDDRHGAGRPSRRQEKDARARRKTRRRRTTSRRPRST